VTAKRKTISQWRVMKAEPNGLLLWFDPMVEFPRLFELEPSLRSGVDDCTRGDDTIAQIQKYQQLDLELLPPEVD